MSADEQLRQVYAKFYDQREVLAEAPALTTEYSPADSEQKQAG